MKTKFIEDYIQNPDSAIAHAQESMAGRWYDNVDEELIYKEISSPEFRLYEEIIFSPSVEETMSESRSSAML